MQFADDKRNINLQNVVCTIEGFLTAFAPIDILGPGQIEFLCTIKLKNHEYLQNVMFYPPESFLSTNTSMLQCFSNKNGVEWFLTLPGNLKVIMETWNVLETARIVITGKK